MADEDTQAKIFEVRRRGGSGADHIAAAIKKILPSATKIQVDGEHVSFDLPDDSPARPLPEGTIARYPEK
jgi:hypothetical protein